MTLSETGEYFQKSAGMGFDYMIAWLTEVHLQEGYVLKREKVGDWMYGYTDIYTEPQDNQERRDDVPWYCKVELPKGYRFCHSFSHKHFFEHLEIPFTEKGIFQATLLWNAWTMLPLFSHSCYDERYYLFEDNLLGKLRKADNDMFFQMNNGWRRTRGERDIYMHIGSQLKTFDGYDGDFLNPSVKIEGDKAKVRTAYWNDHKGLVLSEQQVMMVGDTVAFGRETSHVILEYDCGVVY